ncbi:MAG: lytic transglycosylase domain-containing protein [Nitrospirota bacterium]
MARFVHRRWQNLCMFLRAVGRTPPATRLGISVLLLFVVLLGINWAYHTFYKPTELFFPVEKALSKNPRQTWQEYGALFETHSTAIITPELLAALAQAEGSGNPVARTYWRWRVVSSNPLEWYQPASTAVGMFQITDGTFQEGKRYCIHNHVVVEDGPWHNFNSCWFNGLYTRVIPGHAIELTAAFLDRQVAKAVGERPTTFQQKQDLAAVIHLCGAGTGRDYAKRNFRLMPHQRCGDHEVETYLTRVKTMEHIFARLAAGLTSTSIHR